MFPCYINGVSYFIVHLDTHKYVGKIERGMERPPTYCFFFCQNLVFDPETNAVLRAEMAKKNLYVKRGKNLVFLSISVNAFINRRICMSIAVLFKFHFWCL